MRHRLQEGRFLKGPHTHRNINLSSHDHQSNRNPKRSVQKLSNRDAPTYCVRHNQTGNGKPQLRIYAEVRFVNTLISHRRRPRPLSNGRNEIGHPDGSAALQQILHAAGSRKTWKYILPALSLDSGITQCVARNRREFFEKVAGTIERRLVLRGIYALLAKPFNRDSIGPRLRLESLVSSTFARRTDVFLNPLCTVSPSRVAGFRTPP